MGVGVSITTAKRFSMNQPYTEELRNSFGVALLFLELEDCGRGGGRVY